MSIAITFDTLGYCERLTSVGVPEAQARVQVEAIQDIVRSYDDASRKELATKGDIQDVRNEIQVLRSEMQSELQDIRNAMEKMELRITIRLGMMMAASVAIVAALVKLL